MGAAPVMVVATPKLLRGVPGGNGSAFGIVAPAVMPVYWSASPVPVTNSPPTTLDMSSEIDESTTAALNHRRAAAPFGHGAVHDIGKLRIFASYHCSRYNTNTGVLTPKMFQDVFAAARAYLDAGPQRMG